VTQRDRPAGPVVVTGVSGFIGGPVARALLAAGYAVEGWSRRRPEGVPDGEHFHHRSVDLLAQSTVPDTSGSAVPGTFGEVPDTSGSAVPGTFGGVPDTSGSAVPGTFGEVPDTSGSAVPGTFGEVPDTSGSGGVPDTSGSASGGAAGGAPAAVIHGAALTHVHPTAELLERLYALNVGGTERVLEWAGAAGVRRFVLLSSVKAQGVPPAGSVGRESDTPRPEGPYGEAKLVAEQRLAAWCTEDSGAGHREGIALRLPLVHGPGVRGNLATMARAARRGLMPAIGDGAARRSLVSVHNVAAAITALLAAPPRPGFRVYLVTDHEPYTVAELRRALISAAGRPVLQPRLPMPLARWLARAGDLGEAVLRRPLPFSTAVLARLTEDSVYSSEALQSDTGWRPEGGLEESAARMVAALRASPDES
jgi:UDP-glucose 4-epimerase